MWPQAFLSVPWSSSRSTSPVGDTIPLAITCLSRTEALIEQQSEGEPGSTSRGTSITKGLTRPCGRHIYTHHDGISAVRFLDEKIVISGTDGTARQCRLGESGDHATEIVELVRSQEGSNVQAISKDGRWIVLAVHEGRRIAIWDLITRQRSIESIDAHKQRISALDISSDASKVASGSRDGKVMVWCLETGQPFAGPFQLQQGTSVFCLRFSPRGDCLACIQWRSIHIWNVYNGNKVSIIPTDPAYSLTWSNDGRRILAGYSRGSVMCFDLLASTPVMPEWRYSPHSDTISTLCLSNNGKFIVSASHAESCIKIWDVHTQTQLGSLEHASVVLHAEISPDDGHLVCATEDRKFYLWDIREVIGRPRCFRSLTIPMSDSCPDPHSIFTEISNAAYISWRRVELTRAEQILSNEIARDSLDLLCYHRANRALVRTRLRQWSEALEDAQSSFCLKPLLVAQLAMRIALAGLGNYEAAIAKLDDTLENCDPAERNLAKLIKAITLFDVGSHDEALRHMDDLVAGSPDVERLCAFVQAGEHSAVLNVTLMCMQAKMYASLAADATDAQEHSKAVSLFMQARDRCPAGQCSEMDTVSLVSSRPSLGEPTEMLCKITGWVFDGLRLTIYQQMCELCCDAKYTQEVLYTVQQPESNFKDEIKLRRELHGWLISFKLRCTDMLENQGDLAMHKQDYDSAAAQYSAAEARAALHLWKDALQDADEAIRLDPSAPQGYERRHAALHRLERYQDAIEAWKTMISMIESSPEPSIRQLRGNYVNPSDTMEAILDAATKSVQNSPFRLIDTISGRLCNADERKDSFKEDPIFQETVSSMTTQLDREHIHTVTKRFFRYIMLSHRWEPVELKLADVLGKSVYDLDASPSATKHQRFCSLARDAKIRWAWSDTCCIDKDKEAEFEKSINLMFQWYYYRRPRSSIWRAYQPLLIRGGLMGSVWLTRGWTLQELLAPRIVRFYYDDWTPYLHNTSLNHKECAEIMRELKDATCVTANDLLDFCPGLNDIAVKLRLASTRETTEPEDTAYGLFGIFGVKMSVIRGESQQNALGRLFQEIVARSGDVACLAWVGQSSNFNSAFPDRLRAYEHPSRTIALMGEAEMESRVTGLRRVWTREKEARAISFYKRLHKLPPACCANQHVSLPCIVFPAMTLSRVKQTEYDATTEALEDTRIYSGAEGLPWAQNLFLVCPWIDQLLDAVPGRYAEACPNSGPSSSRSYNARTESKASRLAVRIRQPLCALLLLALGREQYRRVVTENEIIIRVRDAVSLDDMVLQKLEII